MQIGASPVQQQGASLEVTRNKAREVTQQLVTEHQQKVGTTDGAAATRGVPGANDVAELTEEALQKVPGGQKQEGLGKDGPDVDGMLTALREYVSGKLDSPETAPKAEAPGGGDQEQEKQKKVKVEVEFQPHIRANTIQAPGDAIGEFRVHKEEVEEAAGPGKTQGNRGGQQAGGASGAGGAGGASGAGGVGGASGAGGGGAAANEAPGASDRSEISEEAQGLTGSQAVQGAGGESTREDGKDREVKMSGQAAEALKGQMQGGKAPQAQGAGMIVDSAGSAAPIPEDGGILRTDNWEQAIWVHPGGRLDEGGGLIERYRKLDDSPSHIWFDKRGQDTDEVAKQFAADSKRRPDANESDDKKREVEKLKNPMESVPA